jgi:hypothetical protein
MRNLILILIVFSFSSCKKKTKDVFNTKDQTLVSQADFVSGPSNHSASGQVKVYEKSGVYSLVFTNFKTDSGPDLRVYFSGSTAFTGATEVAALKSIDGDFYYTLSSYDPLKKTVLIWCNQVNVLFGSAVLQ